MSIKSLTYRLSMLLAVCALMLTSCGSDDDVVIDDVDGISVGDGLYMSKTDVDPVASQILTSELVEAADFGSQSRAGFVAGHMFLEAGDYNMYQITAKEITATFGGTTETITADADGCGNNDFILITAVADGPAITVPTAGLYKVSYDNLTGEALLYRIDQPNMIGSATPGGWGSDTSFPVANATATGATWTATDIELREGEMKLRFNCRWTINRRTTDDNFDEGNGYQMFTNFGGSTDNLAIGGANIPIDEASEGIYTVEVKWTPEDQWEMNLTKTGDVTAITFVPDDNQWGIIGDATPTGWDSDTDFNYEGVDAGTYTWKLASIALTDGGTSFKMRANDAWDKELNWGNLTFAGDAAGNFSNGGADTNIYVDVAGNYEITLVTSDEGETYTATINQL
ncbi:MAG: SusF/SusE family outer membrane protein [Saprospiraceae bacterium]